MSDSDWPFAEPKNCAVFTIRQVVTGDHFIDYVSHDQEDGAWQFLSLKAGGASYAKAMIAGLGEVASIDPSLKELADLPLGWCARRPLRNAPWLRAKIEQT